MGADGWLMAARNLALVAVVLALLPPFILQLRSVQGQRSRVRERLMHRQEVFAESRDASLAGGRLDRWQLRAGLSLTWANIVFFLLCVLAVALAALVLMGPWLALLVPFVGAALVFLHWNFLYQRRRRQIFDTLPELIDDTLRAMDAGRSLEQALEDALRDAPAVFAPLAFRLRSAIQAGRDYTGLLDEFAELYQVPPLVLVAVALRTSSRFGSSIRPVLKKVSRSLRSQQEMRREFMAATAETRFTAVAFAVLPLLIGGFMMGMNAGFREVLLNSASGHRMLAMSLALIVMGSAVIFRMVQGVGRG